MERGQYEQSLKHYRDLKNVTDFAKEEGRMEGLEEGREKERLLTIKNSLDGGFSVKQISIITQISLKELKQIISEQGWELK